MFYFEAKEGLWDGVNKTRTYQILAPEGTTSERRVRIE